MAEISLKTLAGGIGNLVDTSKVIKSDVEKIRIAVCGGGGIVDTMTILTETMEKIARKSFLNNIKGGSRLSNKNINKSLVSNTNNIYKTLNKIFAQIQRMQGKSFKGNTSVLTSDNFKRNIRDDRYGKLDRISKSIEIVERLKSIKMKDFILAKTKLKHIGKIMFKSLNMFRMFKNEKEMEKTISFVDSSVDLIKKLTKVSLLSKPAQRGAKAIEKILFGKSGKGGLVNTLRKLDNIKNKRAVKSAPKNALKVAAFCGSMIISAIALTTVAVLGPTALLGAVVTSGIVLVLTGTFKLLGKSIGALTKGSIAMALLGTGLLAFSVGFMILRKSTKDLKLKEVGVMVASIAGTGLAVAGVGLLALPIAIGSGVMLLMGASLGVFALSLRSWNNFDSKPAIDSIEYAITGLRQVFGFEKKQEEGEEKPGFWKSLGTKLGAGVSGICGALGGIGQFAELVTIAAGVLTMDVIRLSLIPWESYDVRPATDNITKNIGYIKEAFFPKVVDGEKKGFWGNIANKLGTGLEGLCGAIGGIGQFAELASITTAILTMDVIRVALIPWESYDARPATDNITKNIGYIKEAFFPKVVDGEKKGFWGNIANKLGTGLEGLCGAIGGIGQFTELATISAGILAMDVIRVALIPWKKYDGTQEIGNIKTAITNAYNLCNMISSVDETLKGVDLIPFNLKSNAITNMFRKMSKFSINSNLFEPVKKSINAINSLDLEKAKEMNNLLKTFTKIKNSKSIDRFSNAVNKFVNACNEMTESLNDFSKANINITQSTSNAEPNEVSVPVSSTITSGVNINNTQQLADAIAQALRSLNIRLNPNMLDINLVAEGGSGKTVKLTLQD